VNRLVTVTDLTRMQHGFVCVAGRAEDGEWVRLASPRVRESALRAEGQPAIYPSAVIECGLLENVPEPPHTEDYRYEPRSVRFQWRLPPEAWQQLLERSCFGSVAEIFEQPICRENGWYLADGQGPRSLGTLRPRGIAGVRYAKSPEGTWDFRLAFFDGAGEFYRLKITDFTWHRYAAAQRAAAPEPEALAGRLTAQLKRRGQKVLLRIGLSRGWKKFPGRCYLQINGLYAFPDLLEGKTFADFA
jgi:hypothetical protein